jgi:lipopolysaccharide transport system ATP-binding protein
MNDVVIKVEDLSKQYRLGVISTGSLAHDVNRWWYRLQGKEDPYLKIGEENDRTRKGSSEYVWALRDVGFEVTQGQVVGIIGRNGAGKSTLLKILSRTTAPTIGTVKIKGRVASLLEVGTGFHPELSGRDNIFLNGAILGMTRQEIKRKFDEIVDFAGVERYIDTPVKRYSSGMYVRLAFAVAAHLEPEILIVDEVLAVGDAEFQKKCLGKMKDVSDKEGRTVLFVSHNMAAVKSLCREAILLQQGKMASQGKVIDIVDTYLHAGAKPAALQDIPDSLRFYSTGEAYFRSIAVLGLDGDTTQAIPFNSPISIDFAIEIIRDIPDLFFDMKVVSREGIELSLSQSSLDNMPLLDLAKGGYSFRAEIGNQFQPGHYYLTVGMHHGNGATIDYLETIIGFEVLNFSYSDGQDYNQSWNHGYFRPVTKWSQQ